MAKIHVMEGGSRDNQYRVVVHTPVPAGNNAAGVPWQTALVNSGRAVTGMVEGTGPGQITAAEKAQVVAGQLYEGSFEVLIDPAWTNAQRNAWLDQEAQKFIDEITDKLAISLRNFGATRS